MFGFAKKKQKSLIKEIINQGLGGQSFLYTIFKDELDVTPDDIGKLELTYFTLASLRCGFDHYFDNSELLMHEAANGLFMETLPTLQGTIKMRDAMSNYDQYCDGYRKRIESAFNNPLEGQYRQLAQLLYKRVTDQEVSGKQEIYFFSGGDIFIENFIIDSFAFAEKRSDRQAVT